MSAKFKGFLLNELKDRDLQENFQRLQNFFDQNPIIGGQWKFFDLSFKEDLTNFKLKHGLSFVPKDVILMSVVGPGSIVFNYELFNAVDINVTISGTSPTIPSVFRFLVGKVGG